MPYRTPELLLRLQTDEAERSPGKNRKNRVFRFCRKHADNPSDPELYELYRTAEVLTAAFDCGKLLCCDAEQLLPWSTLMVLDLIRTAATILQAQGYPAEIPADLAETKPVNAQYRKAPPRPTDAELQNEYNYILAENITKKLLEKGLVSVDEFNKIMAKNRESFSPFFARI